MELGVRVLFFIFMYVSWTKGNSQIVMELILEKFLKLLPLTTLWVILMSTAS